MTVWEGLSALDGKTPIKVIATGVPWVGGKGSKSSNVKTGPMIQVWILRADVSPLDAISRGLDEAICGTCPHRSKASGGTAVCYVEVGRAPQRIWIADRDNGSTPFVLAAFVNQRIRFGAYGDPAAVPASVWQELQSVAREVTGYTHAWRTADPAFAGFTMASVDSVEEWPVAKSAGYRSFVVLESNAAKPRGAAHCPASAERGNLTTCFDCLKCSGTGSGRTGDVFINAHGASKAKFLPLSVA
jgi:hypothetical protein